MQQSNPGVPSKTDPAVINALIFIGQTIYFGHRGLKVQGGYKDETLYAQKSEFFRSSIKSAWSTPCHVGSVLQAILLVLGILSNWWPNACAYLEGHQATTNCLLFARRSQRPDTVRSLCRISDDFKKFKVSIKLLSCTGRAGLMLRFGPPVEQLLY